MSVVRHYVSLSGSYHKSQHFLSFTFFIAKNCSTRSYARANILNIDILQTAEIIKASMSIQMVDYMYTCKA